ncbi:MAG TPA: hypothetical protein VJ731_13000 [Terriglobales bacterium]|nr:hypothetical protein [Terriglobales bacterium]
MSRPKHYDKLPEAKLRRAQKCPGEVWQWLQGKGWTNWTADYLPLLLEIGRRPEYRYSILNFIKPADPLGIRAELAARSQHCSAVRRP